MKLRQKLSVMLIVAMIASLFAGTSIGIAAPKKHAQPKVGSASDIFVETPVVLVTKNGEQITQSFDVASGSDAVLEDLSGVSVTINASPSDALELGCSGKQIQITPAGWMTDLPVTANLSYREASSSDITFSGEVELQENWFAQAAYSGEYYTGVNAEITGPETANLTAKVTAPSGATAKVNYTSGKVVLSETTKAGEYAITLKSGNTVVGLTTVTVADKPALQINLIEEAQVNVGVGETKTLSLTNEAKQYQSSLKATSSDASIATAEADTANGTVDVTGVTAGKSTEIKVTIKAGEETLNDIVNITVDVPSDKKAELFTVDGPITMVKRTTAQLPIKKEVLTDIRDGKAKLTVDNEAVVSLSEKGSGYVTANKAGNALFTIVYNKDGAFKAESMDTLSVEVIDAKNAKFFKEKAVKVEAGKTKSVELTEEAVERLTEEAEDNQSLTFDDKIAEVSLDEVSDPPVVDIVGISRGTTTVTLQIGDYVDICNVEVIDLAGALEDALNKVDSMSPENITDSDKETLKEVVSDIGALNDTLGEAQASEEGIDYDAMDAQMDRVEKLEALLKAAFNIVVEEPQIAETVLNNIFSGESIEITGIGLSADLTGSAKNVQLVIKESSVGSTVGSGSDKADVSPNAVAINMTLTVGSNNDAQPKAPIRLRIPVPESLSGEEELVVYHIHNGKTEKIYPKIADGKLTIYITRFSKFVIDVADYEEPAYSGGGRSGGSGGGKNSYVSYTMHGTWSKNAAGVWVFRKHSGAYAANEWGYINGSYYYFNAEGAMLTGWVNVNNQWFYLDPTEGGTQGRRMTGWVFDPAVNGWFYLDNTGVMLTGWQQIEGKWYYLNPVSDGRRGVKIVNQQIDGFYVDENGVRR